MDIRFGADHGRVGDAIDQHAVIGIKNPYTRMFGTKALGDLLSHGRVHRRGEFRLRAVLSVSTKQETLAVRCGVYWTVRWGSYGIL